MIKAGKLTDEDVEWIVNDIAELGVKIGNQFFFLYKGASLIYGDTRDSVRDGVAINGDNDKPHQWRLVGRREFGECCHPVNRVNPNLIGTVDVNDGGEWHLLPAAAQIND